MQPLKILGLLLPLSLAAAAQGEIVSYSIGAGGVVGFDDSGLYPGATPASGAFAYVASGQTGLVSANGTQYLASAQNPIYVSLKLGSKTITHFDNSIGSIFIGRVDPITGVGFSGDVLNIKAFGPSLDTIDLVIEPNDPNLFANHQLPKTFDFQTQVASIQWRYIHAEGGNIRLTYGDLSQYTTVVAPPPAGIPEPAHLTVLLLAGCLARRRRPTRSRG